MTTTSDSWVSDRLSTDQTYTHSGFRSVVFTYGAGFLRLLSRFGAAEEYQAGDVARVQLEVDLGSAETYSEGDPLPTPLESTVQDAAWDFKHFRTVIRRTGHARRQLGPEDEGASIPSADRMVDAAYDRIRNKIAKTFDDEATYGVPGIISSGTYDLGSNSSTSIDRTVYTKTKSYEKAAGGEISTALANEVHYEAMDDPYGAEVDAYVSSAKQVRKLAELGEGKVVVSGGGAFDPVMTEVTIGGRPVIMMPNLTNSIALGMSRVASDWQVIWNEPNPGRFHVLDLGADSGDTPFNLQISTALAVACLSPQKQVKITGLT